jgi:tetratricopeptide (TPR) repeat protein
MFTKTENNSSEDGIKLDEKLEKTLGKSIKYCPYCGKTDIRENEICFECGRYLHKVRCESKYKCTKCSCNVSKDALYCWNCGERFAEDEVSFKKGMSLWENGKFREAIFYFDKAIKRNPKDARAWYVKAVAFENIGKLEEAIECYDTAIKINPDDLLEEWVEELRVFWNNKGTMLAELQHYETAIYCFEKALEIDSQFVDAWYNKGFVFSKLNNFDEAVRCYDKALAIDSQHTRAWLNKGTAFYRLKSYEDAIRCFDRTIALDPSYVEAWYNKGVVLKRLGLVEEAQKCFEKVQDLRSG